MQTGPLASRQELIALKELPKKVCMETCILVTLPYTSQALENDHGNKKKYNVAEFNVCY